MKPILITSYVNPDLDGVASAFAYAEFMQKMGKKVVVRIMGRINDETEYIFNRFGFMRPKYIDTANSFNKIILVDVSALDGLKRKLLPGNVIEIIDHRKVHEADKFFKAKVQIELVGAAATIIVEKFMQNNVKISKESAILACGAIISNTLNFKGSNVTKRDRKAARWLNKIAKLPKSFWKEVFIAKSDLSGNKLSEQIENDFAVFILGNKKIGIAQLEIIGAKEVIDKRSAEIVRILEKIKIIMNLDLIFLNIIELKKCKNFFIVANDQMKKMLEKVLKVQFTGIVGEGSDLVMRKQIVSLLKEKLENK